MQGRVLAQRYELAEQLGQGGMGSVWRARHLALNSWVAVKLMDEEIAKTDEGAERFKREAHAAASLRSAHVVQVLDYGVDDKTPFLVMELLQGESLATHLGKHGRLTPQRTLSIVTQLTRAVARAHAAGIVHRDLKPDNIFLVQEEEQEIVKVLDFGIAKTIDQNVGGLQTRTGATIGTPHYMSPEQAEGTKAVDYRTDLWAIAVITCESLTGTRPFSGETFGELLLNICARPMPVPSSLGQVPEGFDAWFAKGTARDMEQRFTSAREMADALQQVVTPGVALTSQSGTAQPRGVPAITGYQQRAPGTGQALEVDVPTGAPARWSPTGLVLGALALVLLGGGAGAYLLFGKADSSAASAETGTLDAPSASVLAGAPPSASTPRQELPQAQAGFEPSVAPIAVEPEEEEAAGAVSDLTPTREGSKAPHESKSVAPSRTETRQEGTKPAAPLDDSPSPSGAPTLRCYKDSFTGALRRTSGSMPKGTATFACRKDPFTGQLKR